MVLKTENGSSQGQNLALTGLYVPSSLVYVVDAGNSRIARVDYGNGQVCSGPLPSEKGTR